VGTRTTAERERDPVFYVDGHRKPVYADALIPRGLVGRTGKVLGCRALVVLHDQEGHPVLVTTHRGDQHLTIGLPTILTHYEQAAGLASLKRCKLTKERARELSHDLATQQITLEQQGMDEWLLRKTRKREKSCCRGRN
jgi:hypothetical protein